MFKNIDEVIAYLQERDQNASIANGYTMDEITRAQKTLGITFHDSLVYVLRKLNLDNLEFLDINFGDGHNYLDTLVIVNGEPEEFGIPYTLKIAYTSVCDIFLNNYSGVVYAYDLEAIPELVFQQIGHDFEEFICIGVSLNKEMPNLYVPDNQTRIARLTTRFLANFNIKRGHPFWTSQTAGF